MVKNTLRILPLLLLLPAAACDQPLTEISIECLGEGIDGNSCTYSCDANSECVVQVEVNLEGGDSDHDHDDDDGGEDPGSHVCVDPVVHGASLIDSAECIIPASGIATARCGTDSALLPSCSAEFLEWCDVSAGGDVQACEEEPAAPPARCGPFAATASCDMRFEDACDAVNGSFICDGDDCNSGTCEPPDVAEIKFNWSCAGHSGKCQIDGWNAASEIKKCKEDMQNSGCSSFSIDVTEW